VPSTLATVAVNVTFAGGVTLEGDTASVVVEAAAVSLTATAAELDGTAVADPEYFACTE
jgi:hypothetical protein